MRISRSLLTTSALAFSCVALAATASAAAPSAERHAATDRIVLDVFDATVAYHPLNTPADQGVGTLGSYDDTIYADAKLDTKLGLAAGTLELVRKDPSTGHLIEVLHELVQLSDGSLQFGSTFDRTAVLGGAAVEQRAVGTQGRYAGYAGWNTWTLQPNPGGMGGVVAVEHIVLEKPSSSRR